MTSLEMSFFLFFINSLTQHLELEMLPSYYHPGKEEPIAHVQSGLWPSLDFIGASVPLPEFASPRLVPTAPDGKRGS